MEDNGCLKGISYFGGYWLGAFIGGAIVKDSGLLIGGILGVVAVYLIWKAVEEEQKESKRREEENRRLYDSVLDMQVKLAKKGERQ